jgi:hypothetical protein
MEGQGEGKAKISKGAKSLCLSLYKRETSPPEERVAVIRFVKMPFF